MLLGFTVPWPAQSNTTGAVSAEAGEAPITRALNNSSWVTRVMARGMGASIHDRAGWLVEEPTE
jgi:hypothetical protein